MHNNIKPRFPLFSNGTEFMTWQSLNCEQCVKAVFYNEKKNHFPRYKCSIQAHIEEAAVTDGMGNKRTYDATHSPSCPHKQLTSKPRKRSAKNDKSQQIIFIEG